MQRKSVKSKTLRFLYGKSGNKCAFPDCCEPIFEDDGTLTGECCHIEAFSQGGARFNPDTLIEDKNAEDNLILLCSRHHKIIDSHPQEYTAERLKEIKHNHEQKYSRDTRILNAKMSFALRQSMGVYWRELQEIDKGAIGDRKIEINTNISIPSLMSVAEDFFDEFDFLIDQLRYDDATLIEDLQSICEESGVDLSQFEDVSPFDGRCDIVLNTHFPNRIKEYKLIFYQLCVQVLEELTLRDASYAEHLEKYKRLLLEYHETNYYDRVENI